MAVEKDYEKQTWTARIGTGLNKFLDSISGNTLQLTNTPDSLVQAGSPFTSTRMGHIEDGIENATKLAMGEWWNLPDAFVPVSPSFGVWFSEGYGYLFLDGNLAEFVPIDSFIMYAGTFDDGDGGTVDKAYGIVKKIDYPVTVDNSRLNIIFYMPGAINPVKAPDPSTDTIDYIYFNSSNIILDLPMGLKNPYYTRDNMYIGPEHNNVIVRVDAASDQTLTLDDSGSDADCPVGFITYYQQQGTGQLIFADGGSITLDEVNSEFKTAGQGALIGLWRDAPNHWTLFGQTGA